MIDPSVRSQYTVTIGIECHVQLKTATKLFVGIGNDAREAAPNTLVGPLCFGLPGTLPVLNKQAVHLAMRAAFALGTEPQKVSSFDRKHYFYPDLPLGYQITQFNQPIIRDGALTITVDGKVKTIGIHEAHIEADAGKSTHPTGKEYSLVDLNRAGTPLLEIVSEPQLHSAEEAKAYARELYLAMRYAGVSDCNLYYGNMRFDVNVSVSKTDTLGTRTETKNINSFRAVEKVVEYEVTRQIELLEKGEHIVQETRGWDDAKQRTFSQRSKEDAHDYRYFPEPDIPPIVLDDSHIAAVKDEMPTTPHAWRERLASIGLDGASMETLLDADINDQAVDYLALLAEVLDDTAFAKTLANWLVNIEIPTRADAKTPVNPSLTAQGRLHIYRGIYDLQQAGKLSSSNVKALLGIVFASSQQIQDVAALAQQHNLIQQSDEGAIAKIVTAVLAANPQAVEDVKNGEIKAIGFLVGQVMKQSQGRANPALAQQLIRKQLAL